MGSPVFARAHNAATEQIKTAAILSQRHSEDADDCTTTIARKGSTATGKFILYGFFSRNQENFYEFEILFFCIHKLCFTSQKSEEWVDTSPKELEQQA